MAAAVIRTCRSALQRYCFLFICIVLFYMNIISPHLFLRTFLQMYHRRYLITDAHMRSSIIIKMDESTDYFLCMVYTMERLSWINSFALDDTVYTFCYGVVRWLVILGYIFIATLLHSTVRMMYQSF